MAKTNGSVGVAFCALLIGGTAWGFVNQRTADHPLRWATDSVGFTVQELGAPTLTDGSDQLAVRLAFEAWEIPRSRVRFREDTDPGQRARRDWRANDLHSVTWDPANESGFFGMGSGLVAITPVDYDPRTGEILDADILLDGRRRFATNLDAGAYDVQSIVTHEVGHFLGLDHSPVDGATLTPLATAGDTRLRSLEADDRAAVSALYPIATAQGALAGVVLRGTQPVSGAHVVAENEAGEPASSTLTDARGAFRVEGLDAGTYVVYVQPLTGRLRGADLQLATSGLVVDTQFGTTFYGAGGRSSPAQPERVSVLAGQTVRLDTISALPANAMRLKRLWTERVVRGQNLRLVVSGEGLASADGVIVPARSPSELLLTDPRFSSVTADATLDVSPYAQPGLRNVRVIQSDTWSCVVMTGRLEVRDPAPRVGGLSTTRAAPGETIRIDGTGFVAGARVLIGPGAARTSGLGATLDFEVPAIPNGDYALVVENPDGQATAFAGFVVHGSSVPLPPPVGSTPPAPPAASPTTNGAPSSGCSMGGSQDAPFGALVILALLSLLVMRRPE